MHDMHQALVFHPCLVHEFHDFAFHWQHGLNDLIGAVEANAVDAWTGEVPSGKPTKNYGKSTFFMGKLTISMAIFNSYVKLPEGQLVSKLVRRKWKTATMMEIFFQWKLGHFLAIDGNCKLSTWILLVELPKNYIELSRHLKKSPQSPHFSHGNDGLQSTCPCVAAQPLGPLSERGSSATPHWTSVEWHPSMRLTTGGKTDGEIIYLGFHPKFWGEYWEIIYQSMI